MNLQKLFKAQKQLDDHIVKEKGLEGQDLLDKKTLALQVELGELANEWQMFKFWKEDPKPRRELKRMRSIDGHNYFKEVYKRPLLEEYVDCLHFILSIGNELGYQNVIPSDYLHRADDTTKQFNYVFYTIMSIDERIVCNDYEDMEECYGYLIGGFEELGRQLGLTWEQIEQAYFAKNEINFERQANGY